jgi:DsbC/DsbD-like thiol-disulfide interchange protein
MQVVRSTRRIRIFAGFLCLVASFLAAISQTPPHAHTDLLAREASVAPGANLRLGVHFVLDPGWHIYWSNPGDSGQPPVLKLQLPPGFSAGEIEWPRPERMQSTAELADYGYHDEVLLPVTIHAPASLAAGTPAAIVAEAKWLVCHEVCIPEHAQLRLQLPVAQHAKENPNAAALFARTEKLLPRPMPHGWKTGAASEKGDFVLAIVAGSPLEKVEFFPLEPNQIDNAAAQRLRPMANGVKLVLKKSDLLTKPVRVLRGVLVLGNGTVYRIEGPVRQPIK